jgi:hypothetical protein
VSFPVQLLEGYRHTVLSLEDDQARLIVYLGDAGIDGLARDLRQRCPEATVLPVAPAHYRIEATAFQGDITACHLLPATALLEVRAPNVDVQNVIDALPVRVGRYVLSQTGSLSCGVLAGLGALAMVSHLGSVLGSVRARPGRAW